MGCNGSAGQAEIATIMPALEVPVRLFAPVAGQVWGCWPQGALPPVSLAAIIAGILSVHFTFPCTMPTAFYEIVLLPDGDFALQRTDDDAEPLVRIRFSEEARGFLGEAGIEVAQAMIDAGIEAVEMLGMDTDDLEDEAPEPGEDMLASSRILH